MTSIQPISYPTWKSVIPYLSISQRLVLSKRCPELGKFNNTIPLRIQNVQVTERGVSINNGEATYHVGVITIYPGYTPHHIQAINNAGGHTKDVGRFGGSYEANERIKELKEDIEKQKILIKTQLSYKKTEWTERFLKAFENKIIKLRAEIEEIQKNGYTPPYSYYLQVISNTQIGRRVDRVEYTMQVSLTRHYLLRKLISKKMRILVGTLEFYDNYMSLRRNVRRVVYPGYATISQLREKEAELHLKEVMYPERVIRNLLNYRVLSEKEVTVGLMGRNHGDAVMEQIRALPGAQISDTPGHVFFSTANQFKITFYFEEQRCYLHAIVQKN